MIYPWQQQQWSHIIKQHQQQRLPQALLMTGIDGLGQFEFAKELAQLALCDNSVDQSCGQCRQCHLFLTGGHPDFYCVQPEEASKVIKINQIRNLTDKLVKTPQLAQSQVVIINTLDQMNAKASNALLKTLEEPSGNVLFILVCHRLGSVPITIVSRCQKLHFYVDNETTAVEWLRDSIADEQVEILLRLADGAPLRAKALAEKSILSLRNLLLQKLVGISRNDNPIEGVDALLKQDVADVLMLLRLLFQDVRKCHLGVNIDKWVNLDCAYDIKQLAAYFSITYLQGLLDRVARVGELQRGGIHINPQLALESLFVECVV
jgi:DNA polymerase-3 subunit delta'